MESGDERNTCGSNKKNMTEEKSREGGIIRKLSGMKAHKRCQNSPMIKYNQKCKQLL